ncbi:MAG TPA: hypothetical protein VG225_05385 [Terracidiphilus sp.]|jgi:type IV pilus assembly protein PilN|nr:hypothetical protein [Terracidiphilus sp.]
MRVTINLATRPFADLGPALKRLRIAMGVLALAAIALGIGLHALHSKAEAARAREHSLDGSIARVNQERQSYQSMMRQPDNAQVLDQAGALNTLIDQKAFSWTLAMEDLETVLPGGVQVTTLEPVIDKKDGHITVRLRVVGPRDRNVELVQNLEHSRHFLQPRIVGETLESTGNGTQQLEPVSASSRVNFDLLADYNPAVPAEHKSAEKKLERKQKGEGAEEAPASAHPRVGTPRPGLQRPPSAHRPHAKKPKPNPGVRP